MPDGQVLEFTNVTKRFNEVTAVSDFSARVEPGAVTAFLGPNGAGKTTTLRILLGQVRATSGTATIGGTAFAELRQPLRIIGSVLEETVYRPRRTANRQLTIAAKANGIPLSRVGEVLALVGLEREGDARIGGYSLGMRQRLSVAHALLGDPGALVFDEPANGLDPEGIRWMRLLMRRLADEGRTVLVSSHLLSEVEQVADNVLVLSKGQLVLDSGIETLADPKAGSVVVDAADRAALTTALSAAGFDVEVLRSGLTVRGGDAGTVGAVAAAAGIALSTLMQRGPTLEDVFIELVRGGKLGPRAEAAASQLVASESLGALGAGAAGGGFAGAVVLNDVPVSADVLDAVGVDGAVDENAASEEAPADSVEESSTVENATEDGSVEEAATDESASAVDASEENPADEETSVDDVSLVETLAAEDDSGDEISDDEIPDERVEGQREGAADALSDEQAPARSFDEILFGAAAPSTETDGSGDAPEAAGTEGVEAHGADAAAHDGESTADEGDHAGVEFFSELGATDAPDDAATDTDVSNDAEVSDHADISDEAASDADDVLHDAESEGDAAEHSDGEGDDDPRSAAVSTMLAAAARAYYDDEPKDYPQAEASSDDGAHWSVASTGMIDTVPLASGETAPEGDGIGGESVTDEADSAHDSENHDEHADGDGHDGDEHDHSHHG